MIERGPARPGVPAGVRQGGVVVLAVVGATIIVAAGQDGSRGGVVFGILGVGLSALAVAQLVVESPGSTGVVLGQLPDGERATCARGTEPCPSSRASP